jgi:diguanylate cyclase (GGDEF)-like protein
LDHRSVKRRVDIDGFKTINDTYGHDAGDAALVELAQRLRRVLRPADTLGRFGGDEFVIIGENFSNAREVCDVAERVVDVTSEPWYTGDTSVPVHVSFGIALTDSSLTNVSALLAGADAAMYAAKKVPGSSFEFITHS